MYLTIYVKTYWVIAQRQSWFFDTDRDLSYFLRSDDLQINLLLIGLRSETVNNMRIVYNMKTNFISHQKNVSQISIPGKVTYRSFRLELKEVNLQICEQKKGH